MKRIALLSLVTILFAGTSAFAGNFKVLILVGDARSKEMDVLEATTSLGGHSFTYERVVIEGGKFDGNMRGAQIAWFPWNGPGHDGAYFMDGAEAAFRDWVKNGGAVWISAFDDNFKDPAGKQVGAWLPIDESPVTVQNTADANVILTPEGEKSTLFTTPNAVDLNALTLDDNFADLDSKWVVLGKRADNNQPAICYMQFGKGIYVEACIDTRDDARTAAAKPLIENALVFLAGMLGTPTAVEPADKLASSWGSLKRR